MAFLDRIRNAVEAFKERSSWVIDRIVGMWFYLRQLVEHPEMVWEEFAGDGRRRDIIHRRLDRLWDAFGWFMELWEN